MWVVIQSSIFHSTQKEEGHVRLEMDKTLSTSHLITVTVSTVCTGLFFALVFWVISTIFKVPWRKRIFYFVNFLSLNLWVDSGVFNHIRFILQHNTNDEAKEIFQLAKNRRNERNCRKGLEKIICLHKHTLMYFNIKEYVTIFTLFKICNCRFL